MIRYSSSSGRRSLTRAVAAAVQFVTRAVLQETDSKL